MKVVVRRMLTALPPKMERSILAKRARPSQVTPVRIGTLRLPTNIPTSRSGTTTTAGTLLPAPTARTEFHLHGATP